MGLLEGVSLLALVCIAVPMKHIGGDATLVQTIGPVHGILFLLFVFATFSAAIAYQWKFRTTTWKILLACLIPFGTFYIDWAILRKLDK